MKILAHFSLIGRVGFLDKMLFTKHLSVMIKSGIPLVEAIRSIKNQSKSAQFRQVLDDVLNKVTNGQSLYKAFSGRPDIFDSLYLGLIKTGEESGSLQENLEYLSLQLRKSYEFRKKIQGAMMYPAIVLIATTVIGLGVSYFLLPQLANLFRSLDIDLPLSTRILLFFADLVKNYGIFILISLVALVISLRLLVATSAVKPHWHEFLLRLPIIGGFLEYSELTSLFRNLGIMLQSGLPIDLALEIEHEGTKNLVFKEYVSRMKKIIEKGGALEDELALKHYKHIPEIAYKMIGVGEKSGKLEESFLYLADFFEDEVDDIAKNLTTTLEPILLLGIGLIVAFVSMSIISPIYQFTGSIKR